MSELRRDPITKQWVIIALERAKWPDQIQNHVGKEITSNLEMEGTSAYLFCPGNEESCGEAVLTTMETIKGVGESRNGPFVWCPTSIPPWLEGQR